MVKLLGLLCNQTQKAFDISPLLLQSLINDTKFIENCSFLHNQCEQEMITQINEFKETFDDVMRNGQPVSDTDYEKCGHLVKINTNGYIEYCNLHKYLHTGEDDLGHLAWGHEFVVKEKPQVVKEKYQVSVRKIFQNYLNKVLFLIKKLFYHYIDQKYNSKKYKITDINDVMQIMKNDSLAFKSRSVYQYIEKKSQPGYYYVKLYQKTK